MLANGSKTLAARLAPRAAALRVRPTASAMRAARAAGRRAPAARAGPAAAALHARAAAADMFCYQCEQTDKGTGCTVVGVCGKDAQTAALQDLLVHVAKGAAVWAHLARQADPSAVSQRVDHFVMDAMFETMTNVSFDPAHVAATLAEGKAVLAEARALFEQANKDGAVAPPPEGSAAYLSLGDSVAELEAAALLGDVPVKSRVERLGEDLGGVCEMGLYGLKGACAYYHHAVLLGAEDPVITADLIAAAHDAANPNPTLDEALGLCLRLGEVNVRVMAALDGAHTGKYGHPEPTEVTLVPKEGKCILVSGHDLGDLEEILKATEGTGINVYTHGEMLPAHGYPGLKKYPHLVGSVPNAAWQFQRFTFRDFPGAIVMTSNCIMEPRKSYRDRVFTRRVVSMPNVASVADGDWGPVIAKAQESKGYTAADIETAQAGSNKSTWVGFGHNAVLSQAGDVVAAIKGGDIGGILLTGGCDGSETERNYFTDVAKAVPDNFLIASVGCGAYRVADIGRKDVAGIPQGTLRIGQCNDAYGAALIAMALADAFKTDVNGLPLISAISWLEQKAVAVLLSLLHLGVQNIYLGPALPAFVSPAALQILVEKFKINPIGNAEEDVAAMLDRIGYAKQ